MGGMLKRAWNRLHTNSRSRLIEIEIEIDDRRAISRHSRSRSSSVKTCFRAILDVPAVMSPKGDLVKQRKAGRTKEEEEGLRVKEGVLKAGLGGLVLFTKDNTPEAPNQASFEVISMKDFAQGGAQLPVSADRHLTSEERLEAREIKYRTGAVFVSCIFARVESGMCITMVLPW